jgi:hypothetical protein
VSAIRTAIERRSRERSRGPSRGRGIGGVALAGLLSLAVASPAAAIQIGGTDGETFYTGFQRDWDVGCPGSCPLPDGVLTFNDAFDGFNAPEKGTVTSQDGLPAIAGGRVDFEVSLDLNFFGDLNVASSTSYDPTSDDVRQARFIGDGNFYTPEIAIWQPGNSVMPLLTFEVAFLEVVQAQHSGSPGGQPDGKIILGNPQKSQYGITSALTVTGGTLAGNVGGFGTPAVMEMLLSSPSPEMTKALRNGGYLNLDFTNGVGTSGESTTWNIAIVPEPSTAMLLGLSLLGLVGVARRRRGVA